MIKDTACILRNSWKFVCSDSDQEFFSYMVHVRELKMEAPRFMTTSHFWGWAKSFRTPSCFSYYSRVRDTLGPYLPCFRNMRAPTKPGIKMRICREVFCPGNPLW